MTEEQATPEQIRFLARFNLYLPAHADRWKDVREKLQRGETTLDQLIGKTEGVRTH